MDDILKELGWSDGFRIPVANEENKALELELQKKQKEKENLKSALEDIADRVSGMKKHLANVQHQLDQNQNLIFAQNNQKTAEENLVKLARIEDASLTSDIRKFKKEQGDVIERQNAIQTDIDRVLQQIENLNSVIKWDKDALLAWDEEVSRGEDDTFMLEKFRREDEAKFKELELKRQYLGTEVENKRNRLIGLKNDVLSMEQSLEKTAQMFRRQHVERMYLVQQWEGSVRILHQRDEDINRAIEEIGNLKTLAKERLKDLEEQKNFFENEERNNKEIERETENLNKSNSEIKEKARLVEMAIVEENDKLAELKNILVNTTTQLHKYINSNKSMMKEIETKKENIETLTLKVEKAKEEREKCKNKTTSAAERAKRLEEMIKDEEKSIEKNLVEIKKLNDLMFQVLQQLSELKDGEKCQISDIKRIESYSHTIKREIAKAKAESTKQKQILYNLDITYMERDIVYNRMLGLVEVEDSEQYEKRILELEEVHGKLTATNNLLAKEVTRLEDDIRRITLDFQGDVKEEDTLRSKRQEYVLVVECGQKQVKALRVQNQDKQVDENILKLRVKQAERAIDKVGGKVFTLEKQRLELEEAMKEREIEIKALKDMLTVRRKVLNDQLASLNGRVNLAKVKVEHLKTKYEVIVLKLGKDENGEPLSVTHMKIKGAQEKFELQEIGDKLDSKIKKTEKEILAMENTLKVVNATNNAFRNNLQSIDSNSPEVAEKQELEAIQAEVVEELRMKRSFLDEMDVVTEDLEKQLQKKLKIEETLLRLRKDSEQHKAEIEKELKEQEGKLERADKQLKRLIREIRGTHVQKFQTVEEKDIELRELMEQNEYGLQQLAELVAKTFDTGPVVVRYLSEKGLTLPMIKSPSGSIRHESMTSLKSSSRSSVSSGSTKSSESNVSRSSSCSITPTVVTLDSTKLSESPKSGSKTSTSSSVRGKASVSASRKESRQKSQSATSLKDQK